jgi:hypothetical protein
MEPGQLIFSLLSQAAPVAALLPHVREGQPEIKVYPLRAPQNTPLPYITYQVVSGTADTSAQCELPDRARVQLSLFAQTYAGVTQLHKVCRAALDGQEVGEVGITFDGYQESFQNNATCFLRTQDYLLDGLTS